MRRLWAALAAMVVAGFGQPVAGAPLETYGGLPTIENVRISPDGQMLAFVTTQGEQRRIVIQRIDPRETTIQLNAGAQKLRDLSWAGPHHLIVTTSSTSRLMGTIVSAHAEWYTAVDIDLGTKTQRPLLPLVSTAANIIDGPPQIRFIDGAPIAFVGGTGFIHQMGRAALFRVDLDHGGLTSVQTWGFPYTTSFVVDARGHALAQTQYDGGKSRWSIDLWKGQWVEVDHLDAPLGAPELLGLGRDGASVLVGFGSNDNQDILRELKPDGSAWGEPLHVADAQHLIWDTSTYRLIGDSALVGEEDRYQFYDQRDQKTWRAVVAAFPGARVDLISFTDDHKKFVVRVDSPTDGPGYVFMDADSRKAEWVGNEYATLKSEDVAPVRSIAFEAKDGMMLSGYLTLPRNRDAKSLPLVVFPHGGPAARDEPGFDWWAQAMASRGYGVLQVNYRGSQGFGWDFQSAGFGQWGRKMQTDLSDGVRYLARQGTIDPARVCIVGASYGGYAALAGATLDLGVYRCAASVAGPAELAGFVNWWKSQHGQEGLSGKRYWTRYMGPEATYGEISPAKLAKKVQIPILLIHGKDDTVVPFEQSRIMADALTKAGKPFEFITLKREDHWLSRGETRLQMLESVVAFLEKNNPP